MATAEHGGNFAQCWDECGDPIIQPLDTLQALLGWTSGKDETCVCRIPLRHTKTPKGTSSPRTLICHDMAGGYLQDRFPHGVLSPDEVCYRFCHWHQVDTFIYFSHRFITVPPPGWVAAAHKHGVKVLGTLITEWDEGFERMKAILSSEQTMRNVVKNLTDIAHYYNFDGWLINIENKIEESMLEMLVKFVKTLTESSHAVLPHGEVIWYDSVTNKGQLEWQNALNDFNSQYFDVSDGIFLNYTWTEQNLAQSKDFAVKHGRPCDVWVGVDVYGRGCRGGGGFNTKEAMEVAHSQGLSVALFAQGWTFQKLPKDDFIANDNKFWKLLKDYCYPRRFTELPLSTHFCQGVGNAFYLCGKKISNEAWYNLSVQSIQLSEPCDMVKEDNSYQPNSLVTSLCTDDAYQGGGCLRVDCSFAEQRSLSRNLFQTDIKVTEALLVSYSWKSRSDDGELFLEIKWRTEKNLETIQCLSTSPAERKIQKMETEVVICDPLSREQLSSVLPVLGMCQPDNGVWSTSYFQLDKPDTEATIESIGIGLQTAEMGHVSALLGSVQVMPLSSCTQPLPRVSDLTLDVCTDNSGTGDSQCVKKGWLSWKVTDPDLVDYYNIYGSELKISQIETKNRTEDWTLIGHSGNCSLFIKSGSVTNFVLRSKEIRSVLVQPIPMTGFVPSLSSCCMVEVPIFHASEVR